MSNWQQLKSMKKNSANQNNPTWWKWGDPKKSFHLNDFPRLRKFLEEKWNKKLIDDLALPDRTSLIPDSSFTVNDFKSTFPELKPASSQLTMKTACDMPLERAITMQFACFLLMK